MAEIEKQEGSLLFSLISEMVAELAVPLEKLGGSGSAWEARSTGKERIRTQSW